MKVCPQCGELFPDSYILCKEDGFPLLDDSTERPVPLPERALVGDNEPTAVKTPPPVASLAPQPSLAPQSSPAPVHDGIVDKREESAEVRDIRDDDDTTNRLDAATAANRPPEAMAFNLVSEDLETTRPRTPSAETAPLPDGEPKDDGLEPEQALPSPGAGRDLTADEGPTEVVDHDEPTSINPGAVEAVAAQMDQVLDPAEQPARLPPVQKPEVVLQVREAEAAAAMAAEAAEEPTTPAPFDEKPTTPADFASVHDSAPTPVFNPAPDTPIEEPAPLIDPAGEPTAAPAAAERPPTPVEEPTPYIEPAAGPSSASLLELNPLALAATQPVTDDTEPMVTLDQPAGPEAEAEEPAAAVVAAGPAKALADAVAQAPAGKVTPLMTQEVAYVFSEQPEQVVFGRGKRVLFLAGGVLAAVVAAVVIALAVGRDDTGETHTAAASTQSDAAAKHPPDAAATSVTSPVAARTREAGSPAPDASRVTLKTVDAGPLAPDAVPPAPDATAAATPATPTKRRVRKRVRRHRRRGRRRDRRRGRRKRRFEGLVDPYAQ